MFAFHGWAVLAYHTHDTDSAEQDSLVARFERFVAESGAAGLGRIQRHNGCDAFLVSGQHNHRQEYVIDVYRWLAETAPGSYGLLCVDDDEDKRGAGFAESFRVWRLARGELSEHSDPFLLPRVPTIEDEYDPTRGD